MYFVSRVIFVRIRIASDKGVPICERNVLSFEILCIDFALEQNIQQYDR